MRWDEIDMCVSCSALVPKVFMGQHTDWHARLFDALQELRSVR